MNPLRQEKARHTEEWVKENCQSWAKRFGLHEYEYEVELEAKGSDG